MVEVIVIVSVLAVLAGIASLIMGDTVNAARNNTRKANAILMNRQMSQIRALGGSVGDGPNNKVDTTEMKTVIDCLSKTPPLKIEEITFALEPKPEAGDYELEGNSPNKLVKAILISSK